LDSIANAIERRVKARRKNNLSDTSDIGERIGEIARIAPPIGQKYLNWIPRHDQSYYYWTFFEASNFQTLPYAGGLADQPEWLLADFSAFIELTEYNELIAEKERLERRLLDV